MSYLGENIRKFRKVKGLTVNELARKSNSSVSSISQIETGKRDATFKLILSIAQALDIEIAELVTPPKKNNFKHNLDVVLHLGDQTIVFGSSFSTESDKICWGINVNLSEEKINEELFFETNNHSLLSDEFFKNILNPYLIHQRLRILMRRDVELNITPKDINQNKNMWDDFKSVMIFYQQLVFRSLKNVK
ncbi:hypothetical protein C2I06_19825 [Niallia circulans]|uniref:helix-turn-helix domain-containing protein n=1 Tax=Niallia circulans TaxID=1397 RepID=UPI000F44AF3D|nr:helix-turn-helix transcriptional regulator [Niallia circulans]AYV68921.1 hypothetical protein C2I06_19825 [Niallia circulans]